MSLAQKHFNIPLVLEPEYLASPHLDELSGMTYLSYFMKEEGRSERKRRELSFQEGRRTEP